MGEGINFLFRKQVEEKGLTVSKQLESVVINCWVFIVMFIF